MHQVFKRSNLTTKTKIVQTTLDNNLFICFGCFLMNEIKLWIMINIEIFPFKSLSHCAIFWYIRAVFVMSRSHCEVSTCCPLLVINVKCILASYLQENYIVFFYYMNSYFAEIFLGVGHPEVCVPHCLTALTCHAGLRGNRVAGLIVRVQTCTDQMGQAHEGHQEHKEAYR